MLKFSIGDMVDHVVNGAKTSLVGHGNGLITIIFLSHGPSAVVILARMTIFKNQYIYRKAARTCIGVSLANESLLLHWQVSQAGRTVFIRVSHVNTTYNSNLQCNVTIDGRIPSHSQWCFLWWTYSRHTKYLDTCVKSSFSRGPHGKIFCGKNSNSGRPSKTTIWHMVLSGVQTLRVSTVDISSPLDFLRTRKQRVNGLLPPVWGYFKVEFPCWGSWLKCSSHCFTLFTLHTPLFDKMAFRLKEEKQLINNKQTEGKTTERKTKEKLERVFARRSKSNCDFLPYNTKADNTQLVSHRVELPLNQCDICNLIVHSL